MSVWHRTRAMGRLARWLGPWAGADARPSVERRTVEVAGDRPFPAWIYRPAGEAPSGRLLLVPGLHPDGPADPRLDRFAAILAAAGFEVCAPFLPDFRALVLDPRLFGDVERAFDVCRALGDEPPGVVGISFGSLPAVRLAAARPVRGLLLFGGYADLDDALRHCLVGSPGVPRDPLNAPVVFLNLIAGLPGRPADPGPLVAAWRRFVAETWGRPEMKAADRWPAVARAIAADLPPDLRPLFLVTCGAEPGAPALLEAALAAGPDRAWLDPRPHLAAVRCPVHVVHGAGDDVIPHRHARLLADALPNAALHVTGLYDHTGRPPGASLRELRTMLRILRAFADTAGA